jgi:hypothetical protein
MPNSPEDTNPGILVSLTTPANEVVFHREAAKLLARLKTLRDMQESPNEPPPGLSEDELARRLTWDMVGMLVRNSVVLDAATTAVIASTEVQQEKNEIARVEQGIRLRELARKEQADEVERGRLETAKRRGDRVWDVATRGVGTAVTWVCDVLSQPNVKVGVASAIVSIITTLGAILTAYLVIQSGVSVP